MNELALFSGAGGGILAGQLLGHRTVCAVEWSEYPALALIQRQNDGLLPKFPIWDDVQTFDGKPWRGIVDVVSGGFPCQDISSAGTGEGVNGSRSGMWYHMARIISEVRPQYVFIENSPNLTRLGLNIVLSNLAEMGYDAEWGCISGKDLGAPCVRERLWIVAAKPVKNRLDEVYKIQKSECFKSDLWDTRRFNSLLDGCKLWNDTQSGGDILGDGLSSWVGESESLGNAQIPIVAATAFRVLMDRLNKR